MRRGAGALQVSRFNPLELAGSTRYIPARCPIERAAARGRHELELLSERLGASPEGDSTPRANHFR
ncbi:MAG: hypothetical protein WC423_16405 [Vulcanimicrobiota bacterium]